MTTPTLKQFINNAGVKTDADFKIQLASDASGSYVPVVSLDTGAGLTVTTAGNTGADGSTTITSGGAAQNLFGGTAPTNGFEISNPDLSEDLWISDSTTAAANNTGSYRVGPNGGTYTTPTGYKPVGAVSVIAATTGHKITARKW